MKKCIASDVTFALLSCFVQKTRLPHDANDETFSSLFLLIAFNFSFLFISFPASLHEAA